MAEKRRSLMEPYEAHRTLGLTDEEYALIEEILGRSPTPLELAMYAVMWSEHCSYKSSRLHLRRLPTTGEAVLVGPGENAGVLDVGDGVAIAIRIESHNHPSAIEPYQGAATGVGGIIRDIFTMGARPIALMDPLFFAPLETPRSRYLFEGIVSGIAGYGNAVGVPTVGGSLTFDACYEGNPLVNVLCLGILPIDRLVLGRASGVGNLAVLLGSRTGRDGIGGVSVLASAGLSDTDTGGAKRPSVQVADPFEEKRLIEACLELLDQDLVVGLQDLGGAGLACATSETAARAGLGMDVDVSVVPLREPGMSPSEVMTSESQERMLAIVEPANLDRLLALCHRFEVLATVVGTVVAPEGDTEGELLVHEGKKGPIVGRVPAASLADKAPLYDRPRHPPADLDERRLDDPGCLDPPEDCGEDLLRLVIDPGAVITQYDHQLFGNTVLGPGDGDATVLRLAGPGIPFAGRGLALTTDASPGWCLLDPRGGTAATVAEAALNLACVGARPLAVVNCLNFGNPLHPEVMWQLSEAIDGMADACRALEIPVVGGNVSLYNEHDGRDIDPTPVIGMVGVIDHLSSRPPGLGAVQGDHLVLLGVTTASLGGSRWARQIRRHRDGMPPQIDLDLHRRLLRLLAELFVGLAESGIHGVHDVSDGGLALCLAEICLASHLGCQVDGITSHLQLFSESGSRVVVTTADPDTVVARAAAAGIPSTVLGVIGGDRLVVAGLIDRSLEEIAAAASANLG